MKKEDLKITRYEIERENAKYLIYIIPEDDTLSFYIEKVGYGDLYHIVGFSLDSISINMKTGERHYYDLAEEELINNNLEDWISLADERCLCLVL